MDYHGKITGKRKKKNRQVVDFQLLSDSFCRDYCPTSRKIHLILLNSRIFYVV